MDRKAIGGLVTLENASKVAVLGWTATAHVELATQLGAPVWLRWSLPLALDAYFLAALRARRDRGWAVGLVMVAVAGSHAAHQYDLAGADHATVRAALSAALAVLLILTMWRVVGLSQWRSDVAKREATELATARERLASVGERLARHEATIATLQGELERAEARVAAANARHPLASGGAGRGVVSESSRTRGGGRRGAVVSESSRASGSSRRGAVVSERPWTSDPESELPTDPAGQVRWIAQSFAEGVPLTWRQIQELWPDLSDRTAQHRLTAAQKAQRRHGLTPVASAKEVGS